MDFIHILGLNWEIFDDSNLAYIQEQLARGMNPNKQDYGGYSTFHHALNIPADNIGVVEEFIRAGADVNLYTHLDIAPLHFAVTYRKHRVVKALIQSGASINAKDFLGRTSLHLACSFLNVYGRFIYRFVPHSQVIKELLQHEEIDCNAKDLNGNTPLMMAIMYHEMIIAAQLLQDKADPNICNNALETPLHKAFSLRQNYTEIKLLKRGANIYSMDKNGQTPLDILFKCGLFWRTNEWILSILRIIAFHYNITSDLKKKFDIFSQLSHYDIPSGREEKIELIPRLSHYFNKFCDEVDHMKSDFISGNITMHDFCLDSFNLKDFKFEVEEKRNDSILYKLTMPGVSWNCFTENDFKYQQTQIYEPVVERLVRDIYPEYFSPIFDMIPTFNLFSNLEKTANGKKLPEARGSMKSLADLFSLLDIINLFSEHLSKVDFFCLIVALSDVKNVKSMRNLRARNSLNFFDYKYEF